jgi:hypothetical protein
VWHNILEQIRFTNGRAQLNRVFYLIGLRQNRAGVGRFKLLLCGLITVSVKSGWDDGLRPMDDRQSFSLIRRASAMQLKPPHTDFPLSYELKDKIHLKLWVLKQDELLKGRV